MALHVTQLNSQAVLLLKPGIVLFSTDATPLNSGPLFFEPATEAGEEVVERTCDCLTQSLGCHGCGAQIGCASTPRLAR